MSKQQIGVVGMAVMGRNLALNIESRGYTVSIFNRSREKTEEVMLRAAQDRCFAEVQARMRLLIPSSHTSIKVTSSLMVVIPSSRTPFVVTVSFLPKALTSLVPVSPVVKKAR